MNSRNFKSLSNCALQARQRGFSRRFNKTRRIIRKTSAAFAAIPVNLNSAALIPQTRSTPAGLRTRLSFTFVVKPVPQLPPARQSGMLRIWTPAKTFLIQ